MSGTYKPDIGVGIRRDLWVTGPLRPSYKPEVADREVRKSMLDSMKKDEKCRKEAESKKWSIGNWLRGSK